MVDTPRKNLHNHTLLAFEGILFVSEYHVALVVLGLMVIALFSGCIETDMVTENFSGEYNTNENTTLQVMNSNIYFKINTYDGNVELKKLII